MKKFSVGNIGVMAVSLVFSAFAEYGFGQTNYLDFNKVNATPEGAIQLSWNSKTNEVYEIDYADSLIDTNTGNITWNQLYTDYPSHGTNTFIADAGNFDSTPPVVHPKDSPLRFYRVFHVQDNDSSTNPSVTISSVTNSASLSGDVDVEVVASSSEILADVKLYVDGEEQWPAITSTNSQGTNIFKINTCEWPNGPHRLFATAKSQSGLEGLPNGGVVTYGRSVSPYINVTFDNLISRLDLSEKFFEPALGQTQMVSAAFAVNSDWTLEVQDGNNVDVRYETGSGTNMIFAWDGTGTNGEALPDGVYSYLLTAQTNSGSSSIARSLSSETLVSSPTNQWLVAAGDSVSPLALYPPGFDTNGFTIFEGVYEDYLPLSSFSSDDSDSSFESLASSPPANQTTRAPKRKPRIGVKGTVGTFGICYKTYGTNGFTSQHPPTGFPPPLQSRIAIDDQTPTALTVDYRVATFKPMADGFSQLMTKAGWKNQFTKVDSQWSANDIKKTSLGGNSIFNTCNFGILMTHGSFANNSSQGNAPNGVKYTWNWLGNNDFVALSDMDFGSSGTNGLRWMTIIACNMLKPENYNSMNNHGLIPVNDNLHLLLGFSTYAYASTHLGQYYAKWMLASNSIPDSLQLGAAEAYNEGALGSITNTVKMGVSGWHSCFDDSLFIYNDPDLLGLEYRQYTVYIPITGF